MPIGKIDNVHMAVVDQIDGDLFVKGQFDSSVLSVQLDGNSIYVCLERDDQEDVAIKLPRSQVKELIRLLVERL